MASSTYLKYDCDPSQTTPQCPTTCTLPYCAQQRGFSQAKLKSALDGTGNTPFVRLAFVDYNNPEDPNVNDPVNETEPIIITTGNVSSYFRGPPGPENTKPDCSAVITAFQYSWGAIHSGNVCKVTIMDQQGSSFIEWVKKLLKNIEGGGGAKTGVYKMKLKWGWIMTNVGGQSDCPTPVTPYTTTVNGQPVTYYTPTAASTRILCSPDCYFLPNSIVVNLHNGKYIYELEGTDLLQRAQENVIQQVFGSETAKISFKQAVINLSKKSTPRFVVDFVQREQGNAVAPLRFARFLGSTTTPVTASQTTPPIWCPNEGPAGIWACNGLSPLAAISQWLNYVQAEDPANPNGRGLGITFNFDPTYTCTANSNPNCFQVQTGVGAGGGNNCIPVYPPLPDPADLKNPPRGRLLLWADAFHGCRQQNDQFIANRVLATYIVNGGNCSPVISFTPNIKWNFLAAMRAGGTLAPNSPTAHPNIQVPQAGPAQQRGADCGVGGTGQVRGGQTLGRNAVDGGQTAAAAGENIGGHMRANQLLTSIEAELKVQGDPSPELCSPINGYGRSVSLVVMNPYFITEDSQAQTITTTNTMTGSTTTSTTTVPPYGQVSGCPGWSTLSSSNCNNPLTNRNWFIKGVDHQIKAGSYITTYKLALFAPGGDIPAAGQTPQPFGFGMGPFGLGPTPEPLYLGLDDTSSLEFQDGGYQSTVACIDRWPNGSEYINDSATLEVGTLCVKTTV